MGDGADPGGLPEPRGGIRVEHFVYVAGADERRIARLAVPGACVEERLCEGGDYGNALFTGRHDVDQPACSIEPSGGLLAAASGYCGVSVVHVDRRHGDRGSRSRGQPIEAQVKWRAQKNKSPQVATLPPNSLF